MPPLTVAFHISNVRMHSPANRLPLYCDGVIAVVQDQDALFVDGPEFLLVELACAFGTWLSDPAGREFAYTTSDEEEGPTIAFAPRSDGLWQLTSNFVHSPGAFTLHHARDAALRYIQALEEALQEKGFSMRDCPPPTLGVGPWLQLLDPREPPPTGARGD